MLTGACRGLMAEAGNRGDAEGRRDEVHSRRDDGDHVAGVARRGQRGNEGGGRERV